MHVGLIDIDNTRFPTLTLMKLSAWHKAHGNTVELISPADVLGGNLFGKWDMIYASCIFERNKHVADDLAKAGVMVGGSGYDMSRKLPTEIEHIMPDYSLYGITDTAYGFLTRGCPRQCPFCIVKDKEGVSSVKVADLSEWWSGQKFIKLLDPNLLACKAGNELLQQLIDSHARVDFTQGMDARLLTDENIQLIQQIRYDRIHFAWDNPRDKTVPKALRKFKTYTKNLKTDYVKHKVYVLTNYWSTLEEDLMRVYWLRDNNFDPYVMIFDKQNAPQKVHYLQRWVNNKLVFRTIDRFEEYDHTKG